MRYQVHRRSNARARVFARPAPLAPWRPSFARDMRSGDWRSLQILVGLPLGYAIAWSADHLVQLLRWVL